MFNKKGWQPCCHCGQGTGVCKNKIRAFQMILKIIPIPLYSSCASCLIAVNADPVRQDLIVRCNVCKGKGYIWLDPKGEQPQNASVSK